LFAHFSQHGIIGGTAASSKIRNGIKWHEQINPIEIDALPQIPDVYGRLVTDSEGEKK